MRVELQRPKISGTPLASRFFPVNGFQQDSRSGLTPPNGCRLPKEVSPPRLVERAYNELLG